MSSPLQVLQISHDYRGPFQNICRLYCEAFAGSEVTTLYLRGEEDGNVIEATGGNRTLFFNQPEGSLRGLKIGTLIKLYRLFKQNQYDIVIAHRYKAIYLAGIMSYFFPLKVVLGVAHEFKIFRRVFRTIFVTRIRKNIQVLTVSSALLEDVLSDCPSLGLEKRVHVLANAIDPALESSLAGRAEARRRLDILPEKFCYGAVGRLISRKYHDVLIKAYARVASQDNCLVIIGSGPREDGLKALAVDLGINHQVIFTGNVREAYKYYSAFDAFVFTSDDREAFGVVLLEAMLSKVPVICSDAKVPKEIVAETGFTFETSNIDELVSQMARLESLNQDEYQILQQQGYKRLMDNYTLDHFIQHFRDLPALAGLGSKL